VFTHVGQIYWLISDLKLNLKKNLFHFGSFVDILSLFWFCLNAFCFYRPVDKFRLFCPSKLLPLSQKNLKFFSWCSLKRTKHFKAKNVLLSFYHKNRVWKNVKLNTNLIKIKLFSWRGKNESKILILLEIDIVLNWHSLSRKDQKRNQLESQD